MKSHYYLTFLDGETKSLCGRATIDNTDEVEWSNGELEFKDRCKSCWHILTKSLEREFA